MNFISILSEVALSDVRLYGLDEYYALYTTDASERDEKWQKQFENIQNDLRKQVANGFKKHHLFKKMFGKELFKEILPEYFKEKEEQELLAEFNGFTTYFYWFPDGKEKYLYRRSHCFFYRLPLNP